jgi:hypothetical protein
MVKHFRPMFDKSVLDEGIAVDLRLVENARGADGGSLINLQDFVAIGGQPAAAITWQWGRRRASSARRQ